VSESENKGGEGRWVTSYLKLSWGAYTKTEIHDRRRSEDHTFDFGGVLGKTAPDPALAS